jgi:putative membrane protein
MIVLAWFMVLGVAALHGWFLWLEMFQWEAPRTRRIFGTDPAFAAQSRVLAANQGLYNGFLAAGLVIGLLLGVEGYALVTFLLLCVVVAGLYGGVTVAVRVAAVQALPAAVALLVWLAA